MQFHRMIAASALSLVAFASAASASTIVDSTSFEPTTFANVPAGGVQYGPDADPSLTNPPGTTPLLADVPGFAFHGYSGILSNSDTNPGPYGIYPDYPTYYVVLPFAEDGTQAAFLQTLGSNPSIDWTLNNLVANQNYTLTFYAANGQAPNVGPDDLEVLFSGATPAAAPGWITPTVGQYNSYSLDFTAGSSSATISFLARNDGSNDLIGLDNLTVSAVPEPASWALMLLGFGGIGFMARAPRRKTVTA